MWPFRDNIDSFTLGIKKNKSRFRTIDGFRAKGSAYGLLSDGYDWLCPECGGYGKIGVKKKCRYCKGKGTFPLNDKRIECLT